MTLNKSNSRSVSDDLLLSSSRSHFGLGFGLASSHSCSGLTLLLQSSPDKAVATASHRRGRSQTCPQCRQVTTRRQSVRRHNHPKGKLCVGSCSKAFGEVLPQTPIKSLPPQFASCLGEPAHFCCWSPRTCLIEHQLWEQNRFGRIKSLCPQTAPTLQPPS